MTSERQELRSDDAVEALLEKAAPRPAPPKQAETDVRAAVRAEWSAATGQYRRRRVTRNLAMAATVIIAAIFAFAYIEQPPLAVIEVARLDQSRGTVHLQGNDTALADYDSSSSILAGQFLQTGKDSAAGLEWLGGGSLRVDAQTRIEFVAANEIFLHRGRVYFDSHAAVPTSDLAIRTEFGVVSHVGTQYMTEADNKLLVVTVREGEVLIEGNAHRQAVNQGQRAELVGNRRPSITNTSGVGQEWAWVEAVAPNISVDGESAYEFLQWVSRETGFGLEFATGEAEQLARTTLLKGSVNTDPRNELRMRMMTMDLDARFDPAEAVITISSRE